jgi:hypothetical protein
MGYTCNKCGMWVYDNVFHYCVSYWPTYSSHTCVCKDIKCMRVDCIYNLKWWSGTEDKDAVCTNKNIFLDPFGCCMCYVRRNKSDTAQN